MVGGGGTRGRWAWRTVRWIYEEEQREQDIVDLEQVRGGREGYERERKVGK